MKRILTLATVIVPLLAACNTMEGLGTDVKKGGQKIEKEANENKNY